MSTVNTKTARRRLVAYASLTDLCKDLDRIEAANAAGTLKRLGNHEAGSICYHLSLPMKLSFDGMPAGVNGKVGPWWASVVCRLFKKQILGHPFRPGFRVSKEFDPQLWNESLTLNEGLKVLRAEIAMAAAPGAKPSVPHPFFGAMSPADWQAYYLRHAELHLSFLQP